MIQMYIHTVFTCTVYMLHVSLNTAVLILCVFLWLEQGFMSKLVIKLIHVVNLTIFYNAQLVQQLS